MDPRTDTAGRPAEVASFYDHLAPVYDRMTDPARRAERERPAFRRIVERYRIGTAVDAGSGTGFHAILLSQLGVQTTAVDVSRAMLSRLAQEADRLHLHIPIVESPLDTLSTSIAGMYDAVFCLGNTLAHCLTPEALQAVVREFSAVVRPGGLIMLHLLNYDRILARGERIQNVREDEGGMTVRFYDFGERLLRFNILRLERREGKVVPDLSSIDLRPILPAELTASLSTTGFEEIRAYGSIALDPFESRTSNDLVLLALRQQTEARP